MTQSQPGGNLAAVRDAFYDEIASQNLVALWTVLKSLVTPQPASPMRPHLWRYGPMRDALMRAGGLISTEEAERRVLILENPAEPGGSRITRSLYAGLQLVLPGEIALCHRHSQSALRFILEGEKAYTSVDGERAVMLPFDLVLTPSGRWHDHGNETSSPMIWLDGLDIPLVNALDASFAEPLSGQSQHQATNAPGDSLARWGSNLKPARGTAAHPDGMPLFHYPFAQWRAALAALAASSPPDPRDGIRMEFANPADGRAAMRTMSAFCQWLPAGFVTTALQSTDGMIFVGVEGHGTIIVDGVELAVGPRDVVVAPSWSVRAIRAETELVLFSYSDKATQEKLGLWRESST